MNLRTKPYTVIKQQPFCCVPASLAMMLQRKGYTPLSQEEIGYALGLAVPHEYLTLFPRARTKKPSSGYGTEIQQDKYSLHTFFNTNHLPFQETWIYPRDEKTDFGVVIASHIEKDHDIMVCFHHHTLYQSDANWGHASLIESIEGHTLTLVDPDPHAPDLRVVSLPVLLQAITMHGAENRAGFWIISEVHSKYIHSQ